MQIQFADALELGKPRRTKDGYLAVRAKAARTGVYQYAGSEVDPDNAHGLRDAATVNVLRDDKTVFDAKAAHSFIGKPITDDHPSEAVNASNWKDHARGTIMGAKWEEGGYLAFDLLLTDADAIAKVDGGKRELSNGYAAELEFGDFTAADGTKCPVRQASIAGNHVALVDRGRAGPECRISDGGNKIFAACDAATIILNARDGVEEKPVKTMLIDGLTVDIANADTAEATIKTILAARDAATGKLASLEGTVTARDATIVAKDAEIAKLTAAVAAAKLTPAQMRDAGKAYAAIVARAKASGVTVSDEMDEAAIMKAVVDKAMPGNTYTADHVAIAFDALTKDVKPGDGGTTVITTPIIAADAAAKEAQAFTKANDFNSWRNQAA